MIGREEGREDGWEGYLVIMTSRENSSILSSKKECIVLFQNVKHIAKISAG